jgi:hypothetical protein
VTGRWGDRTPLGRVLRASIHVVLAVALSWWLYGYAVGMHNHAIQIPLVHAAADPALYPGDPFVATLDRYATFVWVGLARLQRLVDLDTLLLLGHLSTQAALFAAVWRLASLAFPERPLAPPIAVWSFLWCATDVGGEELHWFYFSHTQVGFASSLWALAAWLSGRRTLGWALAGLTFDVHAMQAVYTFCLLAVGELVLQVLRRAPMRAAAPRLVFRVALGLALTAPTVLWLRRIDASAAPEQLREILETFFPRHFFASALESRDWLPLVAQAALVAAAAYTTARHEHARLLVWMALALLAGGAVAAIMIELHPSPALLKLHVFRAGSTFAVLSLVLGAGLADEAHRRLTAVGKTRAVRPLWHTLAATVAFFAAIAAALSMFPGRVELPVIGRAWVLVLALATALVLFAPAGRWHLRSVLIGSCTLVLLAAVIGERRARRTWRYLAADRPWVDVQRWAKAHTSPDAVFATPPYEEGFRVHSQRTVLGEWKDCAAIMWAPDYTDTWLAWYRAIGGDLDGAPRTSMADRLEALWRALSPAEVEEFASARGADLLVVERATHRARGADGLPLWSSPIVYENQGYFVLRLNSAR